MNLHTKKLFSLTTAALSLLGAITASALADGNATEPFSVQASLVTPRQISLGEPILIRYKVANASSEKAMTHLGASGMDWYTVTMQDNHGVEVPLIPVSRPLRMQGSHSSKSGFFRAGASDTGYILVNERLCIQRPGRYVLTLHINLPYTTGADLTAGTSEAFTESAGLTQTQGITFPILVTQTDPRRLQGTAETLLKAASNLQDSQFGRAAADALFSMPEAQAAASWKDLALKPSMSNDLAASELESLHSQTSVDLLVQMLDTPDLNCVALSDRINRIYNAGSPALREHIKILARQHGFEMPEVAGVPAVMTAPNSDPGGTAF